jgi:hypothetical protein
MQTALTTVGKLESRCPFIGNDNWFGISQENRPHHTSQFSGGRLIHGLSEPRWKWRIVSTSSSAWRVNTALPAHTMMVYCLLSPAIVTQFTGLSPL